MTRTCAQEKWPSRYRRGRFVRMCACARSLGFTRCARIREIPGKRAHAHTRTPLGERAERAARRALGRVISACSWQRSCAVGLAWPKLAATVAWAEGAGGRFRSDPPPSRPSAPAAPALDPGVQHE